MSESDPDKDGVYMICPFCRKVAYTSWTDRELSDWQKRHMIRQDCRK